MDKKTALTAILIVLTAAGYVTAARIAVVVDDGSGGITQNCYDVGDDDMADVVCDKSGFNCADFGGLGKAMCEIRGTGCPIENCFCDASFWGFSTKTSSQWEFSFSEGISGVSVSDGMMLGFRWDDDWGTVPSVNPDFCEICDCGGGKGKHITWIMGMAVAPQVPTIEDTVTIKVTDNKSDKPVRYALVEVFDGVPGITGPIFSARSDKMGVVEFTLEREGDYNVRVSGTKYQHINDELTVSETTTTTTTTTSTSTTTTTTTLKLPKHFLFETTSTVKTTTTTIEEPAVVGAAVAQPVMPQQQESGGILEWIFNLLGI